MQNLIVVNEPRNWPLDIPDVKLVSARAYLTDPAYSDLRRVRVFNLARSYRYQSLGYYVSLLAHARGHKPLPSITSIQEMKLATRVRFVSEDLDELIQKSLAPIKSQEFTLSIYFGRNVAKRYDPLSANLFKLFEAPMLRAHFVREKKWELQRIGPVSANEIAPEHRPFVAAVATEYFARKRSTWRRRSTPRFELAILHNPEEPEPPSDERALHRFVRAAETLDLGAELITRDDYGDVPTYDALFIRETTAVNHHTFRFASRAAAEGLVVIDDPESILRCTNKVFLAEVLDRHEITHPRTLIVHRDNVNRIVSELGLPCILKQPDSAFSQGVVKANTAEEAVAEAERLLERSELVVAQQFLPTPFDWRIGVLDRRPLYACRYYMAEKHWQIIDHRRRGNRRYGKYETVAIDEAPARVVRTALRAANLFGDGLYGVDLKEIGRAAYVIEVNDNPSIETGVEDLVLKDELYLEVMRVFLRRIEGRKQRRARA